MKRLTGSVVVLLSSIFLALFSFHNVYAQDKTALTCDEFLKLTTSEECKYYAFLLDEKKLWCSKTMDGIIKVEGNGIVYNASQMRPADYTLDFDESCLSDKQDQNNLATSNQVSTGPNNQSLKDQTKTSVGAIENWIKDAFGEFNPSQLDVTPVLPSNDQQQHLSAREAKLNDKNMAELQKGLEVDQIKTPYEAVVINRGEKGLNESLIKYPDSSQYKALKTEKIPVGSTIKTGEDAVLISTGSYGLVYIEPDSEVTVSHQGLDQAISQKDASANEFYLHKGTLEVKTKKGGAGGIPKENIQVKTDFVDLVVQSHFWVSQDLEKKQTLVGVYEGKVAVKAKDKLLAFVSPSEGKPGVVTVSQKLSIVKLALVGTVIVTLVGGIPFLRKRLAKTSFSKRKS